MSQANGYDIITYCIKSVYVSRNILLKKDLSLQELDEHLPDQLKEDIEKLITDTKKDWDEFLGSEKYEECIRSLKTKVKIINDSVHKSIVLNSLEVAVIDTPEFSRLRGIKQLGGGSYVYPGAVHTRFEHSIGVCHLAGLFMDKLQKKHKIYKDGEIDVMDKLQEKLKIYKDGETDDLATIDHKEELCVRLAGLCHDLGHGPFSHMFEKLRKKIVKEELISEVISHEEISILLFKQMLIRNMKVLARFCAYKLKWMDVRNIEFMVDPGTKEEKISAKKAFLYEIVANKESGMDVDKWDYYARDCHYLGISNEFDFGRLMELSSIVKDGEDEKNNTTYHIGFQEKEVYNIYRMFRTRTVIHQKACVHPVVQAVEMMISDALFEIRNAKILWNETTDMSLKDTVIQLVKNSRRRSLINLDGYIALKDSLLDIIETTQVSSEASTVSGQVVDKEICKNVLKAQEILMNLKKRELYWCCKEIVIPSDGFRPIEDFMDVKGRSVDGTHFPNEDPSCLFEIEVPKIAYSSEKEDNPVKKIYFYKQEEYLPVGFMYEKDEAIPNTKGSVSELHTPKTFLEYRVRLYCKKEKTRKRKSELQKSYEDFLANHIKRIKTCSD